MVGAAEEAFFVLTYFIQQAEAAVFSRRPSERRVLHDRSDWSLAEGHKVAKAEEVLHAAQKGHFQGGLFCYPLKVIAAEVRTGLHAQDLYHVL